MREEEVGVRIRREAPLVRECGRGISRLESWWWRDSRFWNGGWL